MSRLTVAADTIKNSVSALDVGQMLGLEIRHGRCQCPIHGGTDFNCVLYKGNRGYYCHVCKSGGDVIRFVQEYQRLSFPDAVRWFDGAFHMGLELNGRIDPKKQRQAEIALQMRKRAAEYEAWKDRMRFDLALTAEDLVQRMETIRDEKRPKTYGEWDSEFCEAVRLLPEARRFAEECMMNCMEVKNE